MREPDFRYFGIADSLQIRNDMSVTVTCRDEDGDTLLGPDWLSIARRTHRIHISKSGDEDGLPSSGLRLNAYTKLLKTRVASVSDWHSTEGLNATTTPTIWEVLNSDFLALSFPLEIIDYLVGLGIITSNEYVRLYPNESSDEAIAAILRPDEDVSAVAAAGMKKNPHRRMLVPHRIPKRPIFVLHSSGYRPEIVVTSALRNDLLARFANAVSFYGKGHATPP